MAWTEPPIITSATTGTAADANIWSEDLRYLKLQADSLTASMVKLNRTSAQSIPDSSAETVVWNNELKDIGGWWSSGTDIIMPADYPAGVTAYAVLCPVVAVFASNGTGARGVAIQVNGSDVETYTFDASTSGATTCSVTFTLPDVEEADVITVTVFQDSGGALNLSGVVITAIRLFPSA